MFRWKSALAELTDAISAPTDTISGNYELQHLSTPTDLDRAVKDCGIITTFEPMTVPDGDYLLEYSDQGSRSYYYVLVRKTSP
ncbi:hypothetical protein J2W46_005419 [Paraburkholderia strydomiana]|nr:hypothetical protein [Paraburkholderia strydomiana]